MLLDIEKRNALFRKKQPVYTKIGDNAPVKYGLESNIKDSLIADGCVIEGTVENSVLFRGVKVGKGAVIKDSVIMQGTKIGSNCSISSVITDKNVEISDEKVLTGSETYPLYIVSNCAAGYPEAFMEATGTENCFSGHLCPDDTGLGKAENIRLIMQRQNLEKAYYIGDLDLDRQAAEAAGADFIHAAYGFGKAPEASFRIEDMHGLLEVMRKVESGIN